MKTSCPRCGSSGTLTYERRGNRLYVYIVHSVGNGRTKKCYIGPVDRYVHVDDLRVKLFSTGYNLTNLMNEDPLKVAVSSIKYFLRRLQSGKINNLDQCSAIISEIKSLINEVEKEISSRVSSGEAS